MLLSTLLFEAQLLFLELRASLLDAGDALLELRGELALGEHDEEHLLQVLGPRDPLYLEECAPALVLEAEGRFGARLVDRT